MFIASEKLIAALALACAGLTAHAQPAPRRAAQPGPAEQAQEPLKAAWVYGPEPVSAQWASQRDQARQQALLHLAPKVQTMALPNGAQSAADAERLLRDLVRQGQQIIFTHGLTYMPAVMKVAAECPGVKFECLACLETAPNVAVANIRFYEGRYLAGIAAGRMSESGQIGYVAAFPVPQVLQGINAFALGARSVAPQAQIKVIWLSSWFDPPRERDAAMTLMNQGADVLAHHTASIATVSAAEERGKLAVAYHVDLSAVAPHAQLLADTPQWSGYTNARLQAALEGTWQSQRLWGGIREGMLSVGHFGPRLPEAVRREVLARQADIAQGRLHPFTGPLHDNTGRQALPAGQTLTDQQLAEMHWLAEGVQGTLQR